MLLDSRDDQRLAEFGIALTNLCPRTDAKSGGADARRDRPRARRAGPQDRALENGRLGFVGVSLYAMYFGRVAGGGPEARSRTATGRARVRRAEPERPNASYPGFAHKLVWFKKLRAFAARERAGSGGETEGGSGREGGGKATRKREEGGGRAGRGKGGCSPTPEDGHPLAGG